MLHHHTRSGPEGVEHISVIIKNDVGSDALCGQMHVSIPVQDTAAAGVFAEDESVWSLEQH